MKISNHPHKGSTIRVEPIREPSDVETIKRLLASNPRDYLLFTMGVNCGLRMGQLLRIKVGEVRGLKPGDCLVCRDEKTGKQSTLVVNKAIHKALKAYLDQVEAESSFYLFRSRKGANSPLSVGSVTALVKSWTKAINLEGNFGAESLRKTFGYIQRTRFGVGLDVLAKALNHCSASATRKYLCMEDGSPDSVMLQDI